MKVSDVIKSIFFKESPTENPSFFVTEEKPSLIKIGVCQSDGRLYDNDYMIGDSVCVWTISEVRAALCSTYRILGSNDRVRSSQFVFEDVKPIHFLNVVDSIIGQLRRKRHDDKLLIAELKNKLSKSEIALTELKEKLNMSEAEVNRITYADLGQWPSFSQQQWAAKVSTSVLKRILTDSGAEK